LISIQYVVMVVISTWGGHNRGWVQSTETLQSSVILVVLTL